MDYSGGLRVLVIGFFLLMRRVGGELNEDSTNVCDFCHADDLKVCSLNALNHLNTTMNCELCTLGLEQSFENIENLTVKAFNPTKICLYGHNFETRTTFIPNEDNSSVYEGLEIMVDTIVTTHASADYQDDQAKESVREFRSNPMVQDEDKPKEMITCFSCNSSSDDACVSNVAKLDSIECAQPSDCVTFYHDGHLIRNCSVNIPQEVVQLCQRPDNRSCQICSESKCNNTPWKQCYQCNSKDNRECSLWSNVTSIPISNCPNSNDDCLVSITTDGDTRRDCSRPDYTCPIGELCNICSESMCNGGVFPQTRRHCLQCQNCEELQDPKTAKPCAKFSRNEKCFMQVTANSKMIRGCVSDTEDVEQCEMNQPKCITCDDKDGCNNAPLMKNATLSCIKCNSKDDPSCAWAQLAASATKCQKKVLYYLKETCMMEFDPVTQNARRDCSFDSGACTPADRNCRSCSGDGCNLGNLKVQMCIQCSSQNSEGNDCRTRAELIPPKLCPQDTQMYQTKGCYTQTLGNVTTRDCIAGLSEVDLKNCEAEGKSRCEICEEDGCNNKQAPSGAWTNDPISLLVVFGLVFQAL